MLRSSRKLFRYITRSKSFTKYYATLWENDLGEKSERLYGNWGEKRSRNWTLKRVSVEKVENSSAKFNNGFDYWFTFVINPEEEPTNNEQRERCGPMWF